MTMRQCKTDSDVGACSDSWSEVTGGSGGQAVTRGQWRAGYDRGTV